MFLGFLQNYYFIVEFHERVTDKSSSLGLVPAKHHLAFAEYLKAQEGAGRVENDNIGGPVQ